MQRARSGIGGFYWAAAFLFLSSPVSAEVYVSGQAGESFPFDLRNVEGTGAAHGTTFSSLDLKNAGVYGGKVGYFFDDPGRRWFGAEVEFFTTSSAALQPAAATGSSPTVFSGGAHVRTYVAAVNAMFRHRGRRLEPYAGIGLALVTAEVSAAAFSVRDSSPGLNVLAGIKGFLTDHIALFVEGKYTYTSFQFEDAGLSGAGIKGIYAAPAVVGGLSWHFQ